MFSGLSFLNLSALFLALGIPFLVLAYLKRPPENKQTVASLILLKNLPSAPKLKKRIKLPLRFYLELLCLLLLLAAACHPIFSDKGNLVAVLVDNSMSMGATDDSSGLTRLKKVISKLEASSEVSRDSRFHLFLTSGANSKAKKETLSFNSLLNELKDVEIDPWNDSIPSSLAAINDLGIYKEILALTDKSLSGADGSSVKLVSAAKKSPNFFVSSISLSKRTVKATILLSGEEPVDVRINTGGITSTGQENEIDYAKATLRPYQPKELSFDLGAQFKKFEIFYLTLEGESEKNSIKLDDKVWIDKKGSQDNSVLLISPDIRSRSALGLEKLPFNVEGMHPSQLENKDLSSYSILIFHKSAPEIVPAISSLFINPPVDNGVFQIAGEIDQISVSSYDEQHPVANYLKPWLFDGGSALVLTELAWTHSIINDELGPLVLAGESGGIRFVGSGIELLPFEGRKTPAASVLLLNMLSWLKNEAGFSQTVLTGKSLDPVDFKTDEIVTPDNKSYDSSFIAKVPGLYSIGKKGMFSVNALYPEESDTFNLQSFAAPESPGLISEEHETASPFWKYLLILALLIMCADFLLRIRTRSTGEVA